MSAKPAHSSPATTSRELYLRLLTYARPYWRTIILSFIATAITAMTEPMFPALLKPLLDNGFASGGQPAPGLGNPLWIPLGIVVVFFFRGIFGFLASYGFNWISNRVITDIRNEMYERMVRLPIGYFQQHTSSTPITRITNDVNNVASAATSVLVTIVRDSLTVFGLLLWLVFLNWRLTLICFILIPVIAFVIRAFSARLRRASRAAQTGMAGMLQVLQESVLCNRIIKVFGGEAQEMVRFGKTNNELRTQNMRQGSASAAISPIVRFFAAVAVAIVVYIALVQSAQGTTTVGDFVSFITAMLMILAPLKNLADVNGPLQRALAAAESVFTLLDEPGEADHGQPMPERARGELSFEGVTFTYPGADRPAIQHLSLHIEPGETVALVGPSGGGKSTLVALVPRFFDADLGMIRLDGHTITGIKLADLRANIAYVSQEVLLFNDTIAANIAYGARKNASQQEIEAAARAANALDFISELPDGFATQIGDNGSRLSGGQRQRLAIARAILKDAPVLILDEATSALDNETERLVQAALENLMQNRTTLVIAHRLSTVESAKRIVVLAQGEIIESGSHAELIARNGAYAQLHKLQFAQPS